MRPPPGTDEERPGVQGAFDAEAQTLTLVFGNALGAPMMRTDAGVLFRVVSGDAKGLLGRWEDGGRRNAAAGYFCALKYGPDPIWWTPR
jgi:hypothetical protein